MRLLPLALLGAFLMVFCTVAPDAEAHRLSKTQAKRFAKTEAAEKGDALGLWQTYVHRCRTTGLHDWTCDASGYAGDAADTNSRYTSCTWRVRVSHTGRATSRNTSCRTSGTSEENFNRGYCSVDPDACVDGRPVLSTRRDAPRARLAARLRYCGSVYRDSTHPDSDAIGVRVGTRAKGVSCSTALRHAAALAEGRGLPSGWSCTGNTALTCRRGAKVMTFGIRTLWA